MNRALAMTTNEHSPVADPSDRKLNIFISHKMPADTIEAGHIGAQLAMFSGHLMRVRFSAQYPYGDNWRQLIQDDINQSDMLIYLHTGENEDWLFCLFE